MAIMSLEPVFRMAVGIIYFSQMAALTYFYRRTNDRNVLSDATKEPAPLMIIRSAWAFAVVACVFLYILFPAILSWGNVALSPAFRGIGIGMGVGADLFIFWILRSLGTNISAALKVRHDQALVSNGPYKYVRHPLYSAGVLLFISIALTASNWFLGLIGVAFQTFIMAVRTPMEEAMLLEHFGDRYRSYMKRTGAFLPRIFSSSSPQ